MEFSNFVNQFKPGIFARLEEERLKLVEQGRTVYNLSVGTPDFTPPSYVMQAMSEACLDPNNYKYSLNELPELIEAVQNRFRRRYGVELAADEITMVYGTQEGMSHVGMIFCNPGDVVLVPNPGYPLFEMSAEMAKAELAYYEIREENNYIPVLSEIPEETARAAKYMVVSYPLNPVCACGNDAFYEELIQFARKYDIVIIHDNAYSDIIYTEKPGRSFLSYEGAKEVGVEFYSLSKSYNLTGARVSFLVGNKQIVQKLKVLRSQIDYGAFFVVQRGAIAALNGPDEFIEKQRQEYGRRNHTLCAGLRSIGWNVPDSKGTMFVWGRIPEAYGKDDEKFVMELMRKTGVLVTPGSAFGSNGAGYIRMALVKPVEELQHIVEIIDESGFFK